jgi:hypothetical protein
MPAATALEHVLGMQAQLPQNPYVGLWTRLTNFDPHELSDLIAHRQAVRISMMRSTIHLVTARDCVALRPALQRFLERNFHTGTPFGRLIDGIDTNALIAVGRELLEREPLQFAELGRRLHERWPDHDPTALGYAVRDYLPLVQVPPRGLWRGKGQALHTTAESWLGERIDDDCPPDELVLRYLRAFGPATAADVQTFSGLPAQRAVLERLRPQLRTFTDERGRELFDVADGPLPAPQTPAPVRFLPDFDNVLLSHQDRTRVIPDGFITPGGIGKPMVLVDGFVAATWKLSKTDLQVQPLRKLSRVERSEILSEAQSLLVLFSTDSPITIVE